MRKHLAFLLFLALSHASRADPNDWISVRYVFAQGKQGSPSTAAARQAIIGGAASTANGGPWTITKNNGNLPPSHDPHDYLSWAPYHWPNCNWCSKGANNIWIPSNGTDDDGDFDPSTPDYYDDGGDWGNYSNDSDNAPNAISQAAFPSRMVRVRRQPLDVESPTTATVTITDVPIAVPINDAQTILTPLPPPSASSSSSPAGRETADYVYSSVSPAVDPAKPAHCTPSPTRQLAASATWTTCPYVTRDGQVNPDVRTLTGSSDVIHMTQAVLYNSFAFALSGERTPSYQQVSVSSLDTFFLSPTTAMHPNVNFGQIVRGPGPKGQEGTFTGVLDLRGLVRVINAVMVLRGSGAQGWTAQKEAAFEQWVASYVSWLEQSPLAKKAAGSPNNHGTFFVNQLAAAKYLLGDMQGAVNALRGYFTNQFLDQIAASGEQPFEAVRTRPFHYRAFNLEAMITNAKLGDELGVDFWTAKSKYGATIQTAVNYLMSVNPGKENPLDAVPHVAAIAAAYGDPTGTYNAYLKRTQSTYRSRPYWFYDQSAALPMSPAGKRAHLTSVQQTNGTVSSEGTLDPAPQGPDGRNSSVGGLPSSGSGDVPMPSVKFECPAVFELALDVEIDDDVFVSCADVKPFYGYPL